MFVFFKQKTAYEMRISDWSSDVCSSDLQGRRRGLLHRVGDAHQAGEAALDHDEHHRLALVAASVGDRLRLAAVEPQIGDQPRVAERDRLAVDLARHALAGDRLEVFGFGQGHAALRGAGNDGLGQRVLAAELQRGGKVRSELQSLMRISYAVFCLKKKNNKTKER